MNEIVILSVVGLVVLVVGLVLIRKPRHNNKEVMRGREGPHLRQLTSPHTFNDDSSTTEGVDYDR